MKVPFFVLVIYLISLLIVNNRASSAELYFYHLIWSDPHRDGPWPNPSILLTGSKRKGWPTFEPGIFWSEKGKTVKKLAFCGEIFWTQRWLTLPYPSQASKNWLKLTQGKNFDPYPSLDPYKWDPHLVSPKLSWFDRVFTNLLDFFLKTEYFT